MTLPFALNSEPWKILTLGMDSMDFPSIGLMTLNKHTKDNLQMKRASKQKLILCGRPKLTASAASEPFALEQSADLPAARLEQQKHQHQSIK